MGLGQSLETPKCMPASGQCFACVEYAQLQVKAALSAALGLQNVSILDR